MKTKLFYDRRDYSLDEQINDFLDEEELENCEIQYQSTYAGNGEILESALVIYHE